MEGGGGESRSSSRLSVTLSGAGVAPGCATRNGGGCSSRATSLGVAIAPVCVSDSASSISSAATRARSCELCQRLSRREPPWPFMCVVIGDANVGKAGNLSKTCIAES